MFRASSSTTRFFPTLASANRMPSAYSLQESANALVPSTSVVTHPKERAALLAHLAQLYGVPRIGSFPGGHPASVSRGDVGRLRAEPALAALKTDGVRYLLLLCTLGGAFRAVMIDRRLRMYEVLVYAGEDFFARRTLLDGELVVDHRTGRLCFQAFDVVCMRGRRFRNEPYRDRLQVLHDRVLSALPEGVREDSEAAEGYIVEEDKIYAALSNRGRMCIVPKRFVTLDNARALWEGRNAYPFPTDGLILNFDRSPVQSGTLRSVLKWKPHNAVDVAIEVPSLAVRCRKEGVEVPLRELRCGGRTYRVSMEDNPLVQWLLHRKGHLRQWLLECLVELHDDAKEPGGGRAVLWPMKERSDKAEANDVRVIEATLATITDKVTLDDFLASPSPEGAAGVVAKEEGGGSAAGVARGGTSAHEEASRFLGVAPEAGANVGEEEGSGGSRHSDCGRGATTTKGAPSSSSSVSSSDPSGDASFAVRTRDAEAGSVVPPRARKRAAAGRAGDDHPVPPSRSSARVAARGGEKKRGGGA